MLKLTNRVELHQDRELLGIVNSLVAAVSPSDKSESIKRGKPVLGEQPGWIVFQSVNNTGIAVNLQRLYPSRSELRLRLDAVQISSSILSRFAGEDPARLGLTTGDRPPLDWPIYQVRSSRGLILCAVSFPPPSLNSQGNAATRDSRASACLSKVKLAFLGHCYLPSSVSVGDKLGLGSMKIKCADQQFTGRVFISEEGTMSLERVVESCEELATNPVNQAGVLVRIDLGEIELSLQELAALRSGVRLELKADLPLKCFLRIGATTLAQGELEVNGDNLTVGVTEVLG